MHGPRSYRPVRNFRSRPHSLPHGWRIHPASYSISPDHPNPGPTPLRADFPYRNTCKVSLKSDPGKRQNHISFSFSQFLKFIIKSDCHGKIIPCQSDAYIASTCPMNGNRLWHSCNPRNKMQSQYSQNFRASANQEQKNRPQPAKRPRLKSTFIALSYNRLISRGQSLGKLMSGSRTLLVKNSSAKRKNKTGVKNGRQR